MDIVDFLNAFDAQHGSGDGVETHFSRQSFQKNMAAFAENSASGPKNHRAYANADYWVDPNRTSPADAERTGDDGHVGKSVAEVVDPYAADVEGASAAMDSESDTAVDDQRE